MAELVIKAQATYCNRWPELTVLCDDVVLYNDIVKKQDTVVLTVPDSGAHKICIGMFNKHFGHNNVWDTQSDSSGSIVQDLTLTIEDVTVADVSIMDILLKNLFTVKKSLGQEFLDDVMYCDGTLNFNGNFVFSYSAPLYNSIINQKFKIPVDENKSYFSNYTKIFHYNEEMQLIEDIYGILDEIK